jgi:hypothetical protein
MPYPAPRNGGTRTRIRDISLAGILVVGAMFFIPMASAMDGIGPTVQIPTAQTTENPQTRSLYDLIFAGEYKTVEPVQEETKWWSVSVQAGYSSKYIFRGTNLTPDSDGIEYQQIYWSGKGLTLGAWFATQLGRAKVSGATAVGESGAGQSPFNIPGVASDTAVQWRFRELDLISSYSHNFGPFDVTLGNIVFLIDRGAVDDYRPNLPDTSFVEPFGVPENEQFDRLFLSISYTNLHAWGSQIIPSATYYQTILNHADSIRTPAMGFGPNNAIGPNGTLNPNERAYELQELGFIRNDELGGYFEAKIQSIIPIIKDLLRVETTNLISVSEGDRSHAVPKTMLGPNTGAILTSSAEPYHGFYHYQSGADVILQVTNWLSVTGFYDFAHHLCHTTAGTDRNESWGGGRVTVTF